MHLDLDRRVGIRLLAAAIILGCVVGASTFQPASAQSPVPAPKAGAAATVNVQRNVYAAGGEVRPAGAVPGDFAAAGGRVILDQRVGSDAALAGGAVDVRAPVGDDLRAAGGDINIESSVGGELLAMGGNVTLTRAAAIAGSANVYGGNVTVEGRVDGALTAHAQKIRVNGEVRGDVYLAGADIELGPLAKIGGALRYASPSELKRAEGATIAGAITREDASAAGPKRQRADRGSSQGPSWVGGVFFYLGLLACAAVLMLIAPSFAIHTSERIKTMPWLALAVGLGTLLAVPVLAVLLFITLLGIPLGIIVLSLYPVLLLAGFVVGALFIARLIPAALRQPAPAAYSRNLAYVALAVLLILLVGRVPFVGGVLVGLVSLAGIGACVLELYGRRKGPSAGAHGGRPEALPSAGAGMPEAPGRA